MLPPRSFTQHSCFSSNAMTALPIVDHPKASREFVTNKERSHWHDEALWFVRGKRDKQAHSVPEWEYLRSLAAQVKSHTIANLEQYLLEFEKNATQLGATVHWASDAEDHNRIV